MEEQINSTKESIEAFTTEYEETMNYLASTEGWTATGLMIASFGAAAETAGDKVSVMSSEVQTQMSEMQETLRDTISEQINLFS